MRKKKTRQTNQFIATSSNHILSLEKNVSMIYVTCSNTSDNVYTRISITKCSSNVTIICELNVTPAFPHPHNEENGRFAKKKATKEVLLLPLISTCSEPASNIGKTIQQLTFDQTRHKYDMSIHLQKR